MRRQPDMLHKLFLGGEARQVGPILAEDDADRLRAQRINSGEVDAAEAIERMPQRVHAALPEVFGFVRLGRRRGVIPAARLGVMTASCRRIS